MTKMRILRNTQKYKWQLFTKKPICRILGITTSRLLTKYSAKSLEVLTCTLSLYLLLLWIIIYANKLLQFTLVALEVVVKPTLEKLDFFHIRYGSYISWNISRVFQEYFHTTETFPCYGIGHNYGNWIFQPFAIFPKYFRTMEEV